MIINKAKMSFFAICSTTLTFHKPNPLSQTRTKSCKQKPGDNRLVEILSDPNEGVFFILQQIPANNKYFHQM